MLFYEPLFLTIFPAVYAFYLLVTGASARKWTLLIVSTLFYVWGEPVFVLVLLASTAIDYALSFHLSDPTPARTRRLALAAGIANNLGILIVYKYADFLADNFNFVFGHFARQQDSAAASGAADRRVLCRVRKDHLSGRYLSRHFQARGVIHGLLPVRAVLSKIAGRADPQISRDEGSDRLAAGDRMERFSGRISPFCARPWAQIADRRSARRVRQPDFCSRPRKPERRPRLAWPRQFHAADLFRFCRLFRHGDRARAHAGLSPEGEFQFALYRPVDDRVLAALAHLAHHLDSRLSLYTPRRRPPRRRAHLHQSLDLLPRLRAVARRQLEFCNMGRL